ncbi:protein BRANCHLESS TRICHOME-like [Telopea speciosissima]|uniref:protein BRANCHLESS TRICHOME-like n=1 Tax=Telopea speciosissima TaxID=54955 RepID=UPI001CC498CA|nr:protein BRANCHLESS TRICHOME-like [Telopea speciosissima]
MDEMMALIRRSPEKLRNQAISRATNTTTLPSWKLYENPFYYSPQQRQQQQLLQRRRRHHRVHLPLSARKIAASLWDLSFFTPIMDSELINVSAQMAELRSELELERKARKKMESMNKRLAKELSEVRKGREVIERVCEELAKEIESDKAEIDRMRREMEEERKMLRMAEVFREERVHMKLTEAKILFEEKLLELELDFTKPKKSFQFPSPSPSPAKEAKAEEEERSNYKKNRNEVAISITSPGYGSYLNNNSHNSNSTTTSSCLDNGGGRSTSTSTVNQNHRRASPEVENPHIKRGIKGFVEFPRVVRAIGPRGSHSGSKLKCQKAQLRLLMRHRSPVRSHNFILS